MKLWDWAVYAALTLILATDIYVATKMVFAHGIKLREVTE